AGGSQPGGQRESGHHAHECTTEPRHVNPSRLNSYSPACDQVGPMSSTSEYALGLRAGVSGRRSEPPSAAWAPHGLVEPRAVRRRSPGNWGESSMRTHPWAVDDALWPSDEFRQRLGLDRGYDYDTSR